MDWRADSRSKAKYRDLKSTQVFHTVTTACHNQSEKKKKKKKKSKERYEQGEAKHSITRFMNGYGTSLWIVEPEVADGDKQSRSTRIFRAYMGKCTRLFFATYQYL